MLEVSNVRLPLDAGLPGAAGERLVRGAAARALGAPAAEVAVVRVLKRSVDARKKRDVHFVATLGVELANAAAVRGIDAPNRRTSYYELRIGVVDALLLVYFVALAGVSVALGAGVLA